jgi:hypothetical protein
VFCGEEKSVNTSRVSHRIYAPGFTSVTHPEGPKQFTDDEWVEAFYSKYHFWVLRVGEELLQKDQNSGFAVLQIIFPYFEMIARHREGRHIEPFRKGFEVGMYHVFSESELGDTPKIRKGVIEWLWLNMRNELAHIAFTGKGISISGGFSKPIIWELDKNDNVTEVGINPHIWVERIRQNFESFVEILRDPKNTAERKNFLAYAKRYIKQP